MEKEVNNATETEEVKTANSVQAEQPVEETKNAEQKQGKLSEQTKESLWQSLKFLLFSISAGVIQIVSFTLLSLFVFKDSENLFGWSHLIALLLSVVWNFTFNREFTFKSASNVNIAMLKVAAFYAVFTPATVFGGQALTNVGCNAFLVEALTMVLNFVLEFLYCKYFVYRNSINTNNRAKKD